MKNQLSALTQRSTDGMQQFQSKADQRDLNGLLCYGEDFVEDLAEIMKSSTPAEKEQFFFGSAVLAVWGLITSAIGAS